MSTVLLSQGIWPTLTKTVRGSRQRCAVAVAYFGKGASHLLPLPKGSRLVVDASERSVASGQTCPSDLVTLVKRGVVVYSVANLHAKVFVVGRVAFVGSNNVSSRSAGILLEALLRTTDPGAVRAARTFVEEQCLHELTPERLRQLGRLYRPPQIPGGKRGNGRTKETARRPTLPRLFLAQLHREDWGEEQGIHDTGLRVAKKRRRHPRSFELDSFRLPGKCNYARGDVVIQVVDEPNGTILVGPPGNALYVRTRQAGERQMSFVDVEQPARRPRKISVIARGLGCAQKRLRRDGVVRDASFVQALLGTWAVA